MSLPTASDNPFPSLLLNETTAPSSPAASKRRLYIDANHVLRWKDSAGVDSPLAALNKWDATVAPAVTDDSGDGYAVGSRWIDTTHAKEYICLSASSGAAVWTETTASGGGGGGAVTQIFDSTLSGSAASFDLTSIPGTYNHLRLVLKLRDDGSVTNSAENLRFNADSGSNYDYSYLFNNNATYQGSSASAQTAYSILQGTGANATANSFGTNVIDIPDYAGASHKTLIACGGQVATEGTVSTYRMLNGWGLWRNTAAITRITITPGNGTNFVTGSRATLYGIT